MTPLTIAVIAALAVLCIFFAGIIGQHGLLFYREARSARKLSTLAGAAAVIAIIISILIGVFTQPAPVLTPPSVRIAKPAATGGATPPRTGP